MDARRGAAALFGAAGAVRALAGPPELAQLRPDRRPLIAPGAALPRRRSRSSAGATRELTAPARADARAARRRADAAGARAGAAARRVAAARPAVRARRELLELVAAAARRRPPRDGARRPARARTSCAMPAARSTTRARSPPAAGADARAQRARAVSDGAPSRPRRAAARVSSAGRWRPARWRRRSSRSSLALPIFASDPLSSVAYATEAAIVVLARRRRRVGSISCLPISIAIAALLAIVVALVPADGPRVRDERRRLRRREGEPRHAAEPRRRRGAAHRLRAHRRRLGRGRHPRDHVRRAVARLTQGRRSRSAALVLIARRTSAACASRGSLFALPTYALHRRDRAR